MNKTAVENQLKENASNSKSTKRNRDDKPRKKDEKSIDNVLRLLDGFGNTEQKLGVICQKYAEMFNEHRQLQATVKQAEKKNTILQKEKEQLQADHSKAILRKSKLENLCRELQRQNKDIKEECMLKIREEGEKKREVATKFHSMLSEISSLLAQNNDKNAKLRDDNLDMSMRLKSVCDQFEKKEQHVENLAKQMQLEMQLADAKLAKAKMEMDIEKETLLKEKQALVIELAEYKRKLCEMKASELALREQITMYSDKYEEFHKALLQSNSAIGDFKAEMERMTKHIRRLEKETATWMSRYDGAQRTLTEMTQAKLRSDEAHALSQRRLVALQGICRGLQDQCRQLRGECRRDSQTDEELKKLEDQIREVEKCAELDAKPCPRKMSSEIVPEQEKPQALDKSGSDNIENDSSKPLETDNAETATSSGLECEIAKRDTQSEISRQCELTETSVSNNDIHTDTSGEFVVINENDAYQPSICFNGKESVEISEASKSFETEPEIQKSIESNVNSLVNHSTNSFEKMSLLGNNLKLSNEEGSPKAEQKENEAGSLESNNDGNVPNTTNAKDKCFQQSTSLITDNLYNDKETHDLSNSKDSNENIKESLSKSGSNTSSENCNNMEKDGNKVAISPEDTNQIKNKKKRKNKK